MEDGSKRQKASLSQSAQSHRENIILIAAEGPAIKKISRSAKKGIGRRPSGNDSWSKAFTAMKHFLAGGVSCFKKSSSQRFLKKKALFSAPSVNSSEAGERYRIHELIRTICIRNR